MTVQGPELLRSLTEPPGGWRCTWFDSKGGLCGGTFWPEGLVAAADQD